MPHEFAAPKTVWQAHHGIWLPRTVPLLDSTRWLTFKLYEACLAILHVSLPKTISKGRTHLISNGKFHFELPHILNFHKAMALRDVKIDSYVRCKE